MFTKPLSLPSLAYVRAPYILLIPVLLVSFLPGPSLMGIWESLTFYHTFGAVDAPLSYIISPRANVGGQGYALLEMARAIIHTLHLPLNLSTFRIPAVLFGVISLLFFFTICRRYFGPWPAIGATALLASNQVFFQYEHMMTVVVVSGAAILFLIERLQALEFRFWEKKIWVGLAVSMVFVSLHYGPARIFSVLLISIWFIKAYSLLRMIPGSNSSSRAIWLHGAYCGALFLVLLTLLDYRNFISILRFSSFLFPKNSETMEVIDGESGENGFLRLFSINLEILADSIFGRTGDYHSQYSSYLIADFRYPLLDWGTLPFVFFGFAVAMVSVACRTIFFATPWAYVLVLLVVFSLPLLSSSIVYTRDGVVGTLSVHRMYFMLFPLHLFVAVFLQYVQRANINAILKYMATLCLILVFISQVAKLIEEQSRFENQVFSSDWERNGPLIRNLWDDQMPNIDRQSISGFSHLQQHAQYANVAKQIAAILKTQNSNFVETRARRVIFVDINKFSVAPTAPAGLHYITNRNYHSIFLALYAGEEGIHLNPVVLIDAERVPINPGSMGGLAYKGKPREYSAMTTINENGLLGYSKHLNLIPKIIELTGYSHYDILVTTPEEDAGARYLLSEKKIPFEYVKL